MELPGTGDRLNSVKKMGHGEGFCNIKTEARKLFWENEKISDEKRNQFSRGLIRGWR